MQTVAEGTYFIDTEVSRGWKGIRKCWTFYINKFGREFDSK